MRARGGDGGSFVMQLNFIFISDAAPSTRFTVAAASRLTRLLKSIAIDSSPFRLNQTSQLFIFFFFCSKASKVAAVLQPLQRGPAALSTALVCCVECLAEERH